MNFVKFRIRKIENYHKLSRVFLELRNDKLNDRLDVEDDKWKDLFGKEALKNFWWPTEEEFETYRTLYFNTPVDERGLLPELRVPWDFESLLESIKNGNYELVSCNINEDQMTGLLEFEPWSHPYGGISGIEQLVKCFGHELIESQQ